MGYVYREQGDHVMSWRAQWTIDNPLRRLVHPPHKILKEWIRPGMTVVETGCGTGHFTMAMAQMVGQTGRVVAVDVQPEALAKVERKAETLGLARVVETWRCDADDIGQLLHADFGLSFYMAHEVPDIDAYFRRMAGCIKRGGYLLLAEPKFHVSPDGFNAEVVSAINAGFELASIPSIFFSHASLLQRG